ncbi:MAG TPA: translation initiation factor [Dissulfurispiraceae bacterium]|nr:translation initiation factor [Dissulfurispiraceae bacterium]
MVLYVDIIMLLLQQLFAARHHCAVAVVKSTMRDNGTMLVYSTEQGISRREPSKQKGESIAVPAVQQKVTVRLDRKGRGGKSVTVIEGLQIGTKEKDFLMKQLKSKFGTGGALKDEALEIQGDHRDAILIHLQGMGFRPKKVGG